LPVDEVIAAPEFVKFPEPEKVMFPAAWIAPPGATELPPLMESVPAEVNVPELVKAVLGEMVIFLELVVVCAAVTETSPPMMLISPAELTAPDTVVFPAELDISTAAREVIGAPLVMVDELDSRTVAALIAPEPVLTVEAALEIITSCAAVMVAVVFVNVFDAPVE
jgi:hypothetical protein